MTPWWRSKFVWFNGITAAIGFVAAVWPTVQDLMPKWAWIAGGAAITAVNVALKFVTSDPTYSKQIDDRG